MQGPRHGAHHSSCKKPRRCPAKVKDGVKLLSNLRTRREAELHLSSGDGNVEPRMHVGEHFQQQVFEQAIGLSQSNSFTLSAVLLVFAFIAKNSKVRKTADFPWQLHCVARVRISARGLSGRLLVPP